MHSSKRPQLRLGITAAMLCLCLALFIFWNSLPFVRAQAATNAADAKPAPTPSGTNTNSPGTNSPAAGTNSPAATSHTTNAAVGDTNAVASSSPDGSTNSPADAAVEEKKLPTDLIQLSFQNAQIDQILQWLSENTGKSVVKHPSAHCQVTIVGTKKVTRQEAVTLIYRALAMEGFTAVETGQSILIVPDDKEPKIGPQLLTGTESEVPGGRQRVVRVFTLHHIHSADLSDKIKGVLSDKATIVTDDRANLVILTDYNDNLAAAGALIGALNVDNAANVVVRGIPLKNVNAKTLAAEVAPLYQKLTSKGSKDIIEVSASDTANSLMVLSSEVNFREISKFVQNLDTADAQEKVTKTFLLKNADAEDVAKQLQSLGKDQSQDDNSYYRYIFYENGSSPQDTKKINIVADRRRNAVLVQAPPTAMEGITKTIAALDEPVGENNLAPKIVPLKYVNAGDLEDVLNDLLLKKTTPRNYYYYYDEAPQQQADRDVGRLYGKVRIISEPASNALILTANSQENLDAVLAIIKQLDQPSEAGDTTFHVGLRFAKAQKVANSLNILFAKGGSPPLQPVNQQNQNNANQQQNQNQNQQQQNTSQSNFALEQETKEEGYFPWLGGQPDNARGGSDSRSTTRPVSDLVGRVRVVPDERSNSLMVSANVHYFSQVTKLIDQMDIPTAQVLIEAKVVEVSSDYMDRLGVRYSPSGSQVFTAADKDNAIVASASGTYQQGVGGNTTVNTPNNSTAAGVAAALASLRSGVLSGTVNMDFLVQFLKTHTDATVLSEPQITIEDNQLAKLFVGQRVPTVTGSVNPSLGGSSSTIVYQDVGVILEVEPHINDSGDVEIKVRAESSTVDAAQSPTGGVIIDTRNFRTDLTAKTGQTLVLGGIIQNQISDTVHKTPILGDIPILKYAFSKKDKSNNRVELLVFLRPKVVRSPQEARAMLEEVNKTVPLIQKWEKTEPASSPEPSNTETNAP